MTSLSATLGSFTLISIITFALRAARFSSSYFWLERTDFIHSDKIDLA
nr:unnamed protein product [Moritella viscosa]